MHNSEVMLKDISDSKRTDLLIHDALRRKHSIHAFMHATAISHLFWPQLKSTKFKFPQKIQRFAQYYFASIFSESVVCM
jgi:hypothetical protein